MAASFSLSPRVTIQEDDRSLFSGGSAATVAAIVAPFKRGPDEPTLITSAEEFISLYEVSTDWGFGAHSALAFLQEGTQLLVKRVSTDAKRAGLVVYNNGFSAFDNAPVSGAMPFPFGSFKDFESGTRQFISDTIGGNFVASNSTLITVLDGVTPVATATVLFNTDHNTSVRAIVDAINAIINTGLGGAFAPGGASATIVGGGNALNLIRILVPEGKNYTITMVTTGGAGQPTHTIAANNAAQHKLFEVFAENGGGHGNDLGIKFTTLANSTYQQLLLTFSANFVSLNNIAFAFTYNNQAYNINQVFTVDHATTIAAIGTQIQTILNTAGTVLVDSAARTIKILSPNAGKNDIAASTPLVTLGVSQATCTVTNSAAVEADDTFNMEIYARTNQVTPIKTYTVSLRKIQNGFGQSLYIEDVVNVSVDKSIHLRVNHYEGNPLGQLKGIDTSTIFWLAGGTDGSQPSSATIAAGWELLKDRVTYQNIRLLINGGYADTTVHTKMIDVAETRKDAIALLDVPTASQAASAAVTYRNSTLNANSSYAALFTNNVLIVDPFSQRRMYIPPSGYVAAIMARTLDIAPWLSPAGLNRGLVRNIIGVQFTYTEGEKNALAAAQINPIINNQGGFGYPLWDALTLQKKKSVLSYISSRTNLIYIETQFADAAPFFLQEPINENLFYKIRQFGENILQPMIESGGLRNGRLVAEAVNNKPADEDRGVVNIAVFVDLPRPAREISITIIPTRAGAVFTENVN